LNGGAGNDTIHASLGADILIGGAGKDTFSFDFLPSTFGGPDVDTIKDFSSRDDTIKLMSLYFDGIDTGKLDKAEFVLGTEAKDAGDRIIYDKSTGHLFYDEDGTGGASQVLLATLTNKAALSFTDFVGF
jgi:Ca2+-binding RTX toxin-like protein